MNHRDAFNTFLPEYGSDIYIDIQEIEEERNKTSAQSAYSCRIPSVLGHNKGNILFIRYCKRKKKDTCRL